MGNIERTPKLRVLRCTAPGCGELHLDSTDECVFECDAEFEEVEVVAVDQLRGAVSLDELAAWLTSGEAEDATGIGPNMRGQMVQAIRTRFGGQ